MRRDKRSNRAAANEDSISSQFSEVGIQKGRNCRASGRIKGMGVSTRNRDMDDTVAQALGPTTARGHVDQDCMKYFLELSALIDGGSITDPEERAILCGNALEEAQGKDLVLACDPSCSRVLENLLSSAKIVDIAVFLDRCGMIFPSMIMDMCGSHVAEAALKAVDAALLLEDDQGSWYGAIETALGHICQALGNIIVEVMCNQYGSHVLRRLLFVLSGLKDENTRRPLENKLFGNATGSISMGKNHGGFPRMLEVLTSKILEAAKGTIALLRTDSSAGPVLQTLLKVLKEDEERLIHVVSVALGGAYENCLKEGKVLEGVDFNMVLKLMEDRNGSHLVEAILESISDCLYLEIFQRFFRHHLLQLSLHQISNFVVQTLIAAARDEGQVSMMFEELEASFSELVENRRSGIVASLLAACSRFDIKKREASRALAHAFNPEKVASFNLVPRLLFLEQYASFGSDKVAWKPLFGSKMSVLGCAMLQIVFGFPQEFIQQFSTSFAQIEPHGVLETAKDKGGSHVLEAFLKSSVPAKLKYRTVEKLKGKFAELAMHRLYYHVVDRCYAAGDFKLRTLIVSELATIVPELCKLKHGPYLVNKCDLTRYAKAPQEWKSKQMSRQNKREQFNALFSSENVADVELDNAGTTQTNEKVKNLGRQTWDNEEKQEEQNGGIDRRDDKRSKALPNGAVLIEPTGVQSKRKRKRRGLDAEKRKVKRVHELEGALSLLHFSSKRPMTCNVKENHIKDKKRKVELGS